METFWSGFEKRAATRWVKVAGDKAIIMRYVKEFNSDPNAKHLGKARYVFKDGHHMMHLTRGRGEHSYFRHGEDGKLIMVLNDR